MLTLQSIEKSFKLPLMNEYFLRYLIPSKHQIDVPSTNFDNPIKHKKIIIFGDTASGKTTLARALNNQYIKAYGVDNVNSIISYNISDVLYFGLNKKLVQFHYIDDYTLSNESKDVISSFFKIRNIWKNNYQANNGLIVSIFGLHRFYSSVTELRSVANLILVKSDSINPYDHSLIKKYIGQDGIDDLSLLEEYKEDYPSLKDYSIFHTRSKQTGLVKFPQVKEDNLTDVKILINKFSSVEKMVRISNILKV